MMLVVLQKQNIVDFTTLKRTIREACLISKIAPTDSQLLAALTQEERGMALLCPNTCAIILKSEYVLVKPPAVKF